jgi:hypothetical protein
VSTQTILQKSFDIEKALARSDCATACAIVFEAEDYILQMQREQIKNQKDKVGGQLRPAEFPH